MSIMTFLVCVFFIFFLLNAIYLGYEILLQIFTEFCSAVVKLCEKWGVENANHDISGAFLVQNTPTKFRVAVLSICGVMWKLCQNASIAI